MAAAAHSVESLATEPANDQATEFQTSINEELQSVLIVTTLFVSTLNRSSVAHTYHSACALCHTCKQCLMLSGMEIG